MSGFFPVVSRRYFLAGRIGRGWCTPSHPTSTSRRHASWRPGPTRPRSRRHASPTQVRVAPRSSFSAFCAVCLSLLPNRTHAHWLNRLEAHATHGAREQCDTFPPSHALLPTHSTEAPVGRSRSARGDSCCTNRSSGCPCSTGRRRSCRCGECGERRTVALAPSPLGLAEDFFWSHSKFLFRISLASLVNFAKISRYFFAKYLMWSPGSAVVAKIVSDFAFLCTICPRMLP